MDRIEIGTCRANDSSTKTHKSFPIRYNLWRENIYSVLLTYLYCTKYNEISVCHSDIQKHVSYKKVCKHFVYRLTKQFPDTLLPIRENF